MVEGASSGWTGALQEDISTVKEFNTEMDCAYLQGEEEQISLSLDRKEPISLDDKEQLPGLYTVRTVLEPKQFGPFSSPLQRSTQL